MANPIARMQYIGWVRLTANNNGTPLVAAILPITRCNLDAKPNPVIMEDAIMGGEPGDPASFPVSPVNYAEGKFQFNGDVSFPLFDDSGESNSVVDNVLTAAVSSRDYFHQIEVFDGFQMYDYHFFKVRTLTVGSQAAGNGRLECTMSIEALYRERGTAAIGGQVGGAQAQWKPAVQGTPGTSYVNERPVPFWKTKMILYNTD